MMGESDAKLSAEKIETISRGETKKIDTYMLLAKDFAGYSRASSERVNLSAAVCRMAADMQMRETHVDVKCSVPAEDLFIRAHPTLVAELVGNLLENAAKYTGEGSISVTISTRGKNAVLTIAGTGLPLSEIIAQNLPLPHIDLVPETIEEQIICFADKFFSKTKLDIEKTPEQARKSLEKFGPDSVARFNHWLAIFLP